MKDYLEKRREELRKQGGFTLMEMLIVVAIIAVLIAIAIPVFTTQLERAREATDAANLRSAYGAVVTKYLSEGKATSVDVTAEQQQADWQGPAAEISTTIGSFSEVIKPEASTTGWTVNIDTAGKVTIAKK